MMLKISMLCGSRKLIASKPAVAVYSPEEYCADLSKGVLLTGNPVWDSSKNITLSRPYTDFRFLRIDWYDNSYHSGSFVYNVALFHQLMTTTASERGIPTPTSSMNPISNPERYFAIIDERDMYWEIYRSNSDTSTKSTTTLLRFSRENGVWIQGIWGFK